MADSYGAGAIFQRKDSPRWWIRYSANGRDQRESSKSTDRRVAERLLRKRLGEIQAGTFAPGANALTFDGLIDILKAQYRLKNVKALPRVDRVLQHVREAFGNHKAVNITSVALAQYASERTDAGAANATVLLELSLLRSAFNMAVRLGKLRSAPLLPPLDVKHNARQGHLTRGEVEALTAELPAELRGVVWVCYFVGWRLKSDVLTMQWNQVSPTELRLAPGKSKGKEGRSINLALFPQLQAVLDEQRAYTDKVEKATGRIIPHVFHRDGRPIKTMRQAFNAAAKRAGLEGTIPHDLRRSCARSMERMYLPRSQSMQIMGIRTEHVWSRYAVVNQNDLDSASTRLAQFHAQDSEARKTQPLHPNKVRDQHETRTIRKA